MPETLPCQCGLHINCPFVTMSLIKGPEMDSSFFILSRFKINVSNETPLSSLTLGCWKSILISVQTFLPHSHTSRFNPPVCSGGLSFLHPRNEVVCGTSMNCFEKNTGWQRPICFDTLSLCFPPSTRTLTFVILRAVIACLRNAKQARFDWLYLYAYFNFKCFPDHFHRIEGRCQFTSLTGWYLNE